MANTPTTTMRLDPELKDEALFELLTKASLEMQRLALDKVEKLTAELITESTDLSPLNFKTDANL